MFVMKIFRKIILIPVWIVLLLCWAFMNLTVSIYGICHGLGTLLLGCLIILALCLNMLSNAAVFTGLLALSFVVVFFGAAALAVLEALRHTVMRIILE